MINNEFPGNSKSTPQPEADSKKLDSVVTNEVISKKKSLGRRFRDIFIGGDSSSVLEYVFMDVVVPQVKDMFAEAVTQGFERMIFGETRTSTRRHGSRPMTPPAPTNYTRYSARGNNPIGRSGREDRGGPNAHVRSHDINDIILATRVEAETVLDRMYDLMREYDVVSVSDLYSLIGWSSSHVDQKWGWLDLKGSRADRVSDGYILNIPRPEPLD